MNDVTLVGIDLGKRRFIYMSRIGTGVPFSEIRNPVLGPFLSSWGVILCC